MAKLKLPKAIKQLELTLKNHIGSDGSAHLTATKTSNGFLSYADKIRYDGAVGERINVGSGADILMLEAGRYQGIQFQNSPIAATNSTFQNVDVTIGKSYSGKTLLTRKMLRVQTTVDGKIWERSIHQSGEDTGWRQNVTQKLLWEGSFSKGTLTLSETLSSFDSIKVQFSDENAGHRIAEFPIRSEFSLTSLNLANSTGSSVADMSECRVTISDKVLTIAHNRKMNLNFNATPVDGGSFVETEALKIIKIWGVV